MVSECMFIYGQQEELLRADSINTQILERIFNVSSCNRVVINDLYSEKQITQLRVGM